LGDVGQSALYCWGKVSRVPLDFKPVEYFVNFQVFAKVVAMGLVNEIIKRHEMELGEAR
jgi:hypothetical protein